jgi:Mg-chelatase subunit ChlD
VTFGNPWALLLFVLLPFFIWLSRGQLLHLSRLRRWMALVLRLSLLSLLVLALADARWYSRTDALSVIFLVDQSDSVGSSARQDTLDFIQRALANMPADDSAGVVVFGENALVEESPRPNLQLNGLNSTPLTGHTNFADAIRLGMALFPADSAKRLILLSDGQNNLGDAKAAAQLAAASGIELSTVPLENRGGPEVRLDQLKVPSSLNAKEQFDLELDIHSNLSAQSEVQVYADGQLLTIEQVNLQAGSNRFIFPMTAGGEGFSTFQVRLVPSEDTLSQNNRLDAYSLIEGPLQVLVVARDPAEVINLIPAMEAAGVEPQLIMPQDMPSAPTQLSQYAAVILVNMPAFALSPSQLDLLQVYVRDLGHGLIVVGGPESYGAGGYYQTPLEEILPVDMLLKDKERLPGMSMFMVIDKSGSMESAGTPGGGGPRKVELAKEAIYRSLDLLTPLDRVGVIAFDNAAHWVVPPTEVIDVGRIKNQVGTIRADGGTDILAGLQAAAGASESEVKIIKHIVLLTDGGANPEGIPELVDKLVEQGVSISVVAIGDDYAPFLEDIAKRGQGRFHFARDASTIPQIFAQEATLAQKSYIIEDPFTPRLTAPSSILQGIITLPSLYGYIGTSPKMTAQTVLVSDKDDPILAQWQYGLGRSVAWTSDARGQWARDWVNWDEFARFWGQAVHWTIVEGTQGGLETQVTLDNETGAFRLTAEALDQRGNYLNNLNLRGSLVSPDLAQQDIILTQIAPGLYETELHPTETGAYLLRLLGSDETGQLTNSATQGFVVNYSPEYISDDNLGSLMADLAGLGNGRTLTLANTDGVFAHNLPPVSGANPLWPALLTAFVLLLPLDVGLRRVIIGREEILKLVAHLKGYLPQPKARLRRPIVTTSSATSLLSIKQKTQTTLANQDTPVPSRTISQPDEVPSPDRPSVILNTPSSSKPSQEAPSDFDSATSDDRMSRLLKAKRTARQNTKHDKQSK